VIVQRAEAARQRDEGVGVFHEHDLADIEVPEGHPAIEVGVGSLFFRELDIAADGMPARFPRAAVGPLHDARPAARHHREAAARQACADFPRHLVVAVRFGKAGRAEDGDAGADEAQSPEAADELGEDTERAQELEQPVLGAGEETALFRTRRDLAPPASARRAHLHVGAHGVSPSAPTPSGTAPGAHGAQRRSVSAGYRITLGVPTLAARWLTPESLPR